MKNLVILVILAVIGYALYAYALPAIQGKASGTAIEGRVEGWLNAQKAGDEQTALCMWAKNKPILPQAEMAAYTDRYDAFRRDLDIYSGVSSFSIDSVDDLIVTVTINGQTHRLKIGYGEPISVQ